MLNQVTSKNDKTEDLLGTSLSEFKDYIEYLMTLDVKWKKFHLDHVQPLASFDLTNQEQLKQAAHYTNFQPLLAKDFYRKEIVITWLFKQTEFMIINHINIFLN